MCKEDSVFGDRGRGEVRGEGEVRGGRTGREDAMRRGEEEMWWCNWGKEIEEREVIVEGLLGGRWGWVS